MQPAGDHLILAVDPVVVATAAAGLQLQPPHGAEVQGSLMGDSGSKVADVTAGAVHVNGVGGCDALEGGGGGNLDQKEECRICQDEDSLQNLDIPCACKGTLKFAHTRCVKLWCYEKGDATCEICRQPFKDGYSVLSALYHHDDTSIAISEDWPLPRNPLNLHDPRLLAIAAAEHQVLEARNDDHGHASINGNTFFWFATLILFTLFLLRHAAPLFTGDVESVLTYFYLIFLYVAAVTLPCYLMAWIVHIIQHRRRRQPPTAELAYILRARERRAQQIAISTGSALH